MNEKLYILFYFFKFRLSRILHSNKVSGSLKKKWKKNLQKSKYYSQNYASEFEFPIINKSIFMQNFDDINTVGISRDEALEVAEQSESSRDFTPTINGINVGLSSGTSGNKGIFLTNNREKSIWVAAVLDRVIGFSFRKRKVAFFLRANNNLYESVKSRLLSFSFFDLKTPIEKHIRKLQAFNADILVAQPSVLNVIAKEFQSMKVEFRLSKVISVAEVLEEDQKKYFEKVFNCRVDQVYQCTEGFLAYTCKNGNLHFNEDWLRIEKKYIDKEKKRFYPIITDYLRASQPVVRYELNDIIQQGEPCTCGAKSTVIDKIEGRADDVFVFNRNENEIKIFPDFIRRAVILASDKVQNYQVILKKENLISIYIDVADNSLKKNIYEKVKESVNKMLVDFGVKNVGIIYSPEINHNRLTKLIRVKNEYSKSI